MIPCDEPIYDFFGERVETKGYINLYTTFREGSITKIIPILYMVIDAHTSYNVLLRLPSLNLLGVVVSTPHLAMKFVLASGDIIIVHEDNKRARESSIASLKLPFPPLSTNNIEKASTHGLIMMKG